MKPVTKEKISSGYYNYTCGACNAQWEDKEEAITCCNEIEVSQ